jgi:LAGLIDADG DNA endonuclease family
MAEMSFKASAYNGEALTCIGQEGNTVGSLTGTQRSVIIGSLLGDGAMRLSLAVWFMDDGCRSYRALYLNTQAFDFDSQMRLVEFLSGQWGIKATLNRDKQYFRIRIAVESVSNFQDIVAPLCYRSFNISSQ